MSHSAATAGATVDRQPLSPAVRASGLALALAIIGIDQVTKHLAQSRLDGREPVPVIDGVLQLHLTYNRGAAFSTATSFTWLLALLASLVSVALVVAILRTRSTAWALTLGVLLGGAAGNLVDRFIREPGFGRGAVVDFLALPHWPIFNVADMSVVSAAVLILVINLRGIPFGRTRREPRGTS